MPDRSIMRRGLMAALFAGLACLLALISTAHGDDVRVVVMQFYEFRDPSGSGIKPIDGLELPVATMVDEMVIRSGRGVAGAEDAGIGRTEIKIWIFGRALARHYFEVDDQRYFTGARLRGTVSLMDGSSGVHHRNFSSVMVPPSGFATDPTVFDEPRNAPFAAALAEPDGLARAIAEVMVDAWGIEAIIPSAQHTEASVRGDIARLLGDIGGAAVVPALIDILKTDGSGFVRWQAAWSLGRIGDSRALPHLIGAIGDPERDVRWFAAWSLREMTGEDFGPDVEAWSAWWAAREVSSES